MNACQLALAPTLFAIVLELAHHVSLQRLHYADPCEYRGAAEIGDQDQGLHCGLPRSATLVALGFGMLARASARVTSCRHAAAEWNHRIRAPSC
jgi:hypothetical protein